MKNVGVNYGVRLFSYFTLLNVKSKDKNSTKCTYLDR
jgi:hypothetical protein